MSNQKPKTTLRDGAIKAAIWANEGENGTFYAVTFSRTYKDGDNYADSNSFGGTELLQLTRLVGKAYDKIGEFRQADRDKA